MGEIKEPYPVKLFMGMISAEMGLFKEVEARLIESFGDIDMESPIREWSHTDYYQGEMGTGLMRKFVFFKSLIDPGSIADVKIHTNRVERLYLNNQGGRRINLDPGYIDLSKVVLATTKNYSHRIYLRGGIYAEVTLIYREGEYHPLAHTYRDYASIDYREIFKRARRLYHDQIRQDPGRPLSGKG